MATREEILNNAKKMADGMAGMMNSVKGMLNTLTDSLPAHEKEKVYKLMKDSNVKSEVEKANEAINTIKNNFDLK